MHPAAGGVNPKYQLLFHYQRLNHPLVMSVYYFNLFYLYRLILRLLEDIFQVVNLWADFQHFRSWTLQTDFVKREMFLLQYVCRYALQLYIVFCVVVCR